ncbi:MAG: glutathione peroxidase [Anaerocolumna sp.]|jgi:glutathione peroxidase|nr:glutathione peroxidase [Anaerocolumna sp.]
MAVYDFKVNNYKEEEVGLDKYKGKVLLIVNTATKCGFTPQYDELQDLYEKYKDQGLEILDFPCNQFGAQAPGSNEEIHSFCDAKFGITFPMFSKIEVNGEDAHPLYKYLVEQKGFNGFDEDHELTSVLNEMLGKADPDFAKKPSIKWNFTKFLVDREGKVVARFEPTDNLGIVDEKVRELL